MRNRYLERMDRLIKVKITGSNINNYLKRVIKKKIRVINLVPISYREVHVILKYSEYKKLLELKSIYEIEVLENLGSKKIEASFKKNFMLLGFMVVGVVLLMVLSRMIFSIEIVHSDKKIRELVGDELKRYGVVLYRFKPDYGELEEIKNEILEKNKDVLEWLEISEYGTKYIVRVEERKLNDEEGEFQYQSIVSKKDAVVTRIEALRGEKVRGVNEYVKKGEEVISGYITKPDGTKIPTMAEGVVHGEVWYEVDVDYPIVYQETQFTGNSKTVYALYFWGKRYGLFDFDDYRAVETKSKVLVSSEFPSIRLVREKQYEVIIKDEVYTEDMAKIKAIDYIKDKLKRDNQDIVMISEVKILDTDSDEDSIELKLFVRAIEDIGEVVKIDSGEELEEREE